jgi:hypothetical protein
MSVLDDDGMLSADFIAVEAKDSHGNAQALWVAVRPVFYGEEQSKEPMVQICYQETYMKGQLEGPVWLTPETWEELKKAVDWRLKYRKTRWQRFLHAITIRIAGKIQE